MERLTNWARANLAGKSGANVQADGAFLAISKLGLAEGQSGYLSWDLSGYNVQYDTNAEFRNLPEPAAWLLLLFGLLFFRRRFLKNV